MATIIHYRFGEKCEIQKESRKSNKPNKESTNVKTLKLILQENKATEYGRRYRFENIQSVEQYKAQVPMIEYDDVAEYIERSAKGETNILSSSPIIAFFTSSGSSRKSCKLLPCSDRAMHLMGMKPEYFVGRSPIGLKTWGTPPPKCVAQFGWVPGSSKLPTGVYCGSGSSFFVSKIVSLDPAPICTPRIGFDERITDFETQIHLHLLFALRNKNLHHIGAAFIPTAISVSLMIVRQWTQLLKELSTGRIELDLPKDIKGQLEQELGQNVERATELASLVSDEGNEEEFDGIFAKIWPHLQAIFTLYSGDMIECVPQLRKYVPESIDLYDCIYVMSEGIFAENLWPKEFPPRHLLNVDSVFFEFLPVSSGDTKNLKTLQIHELEVGKFYEEVITNMSGLYRYRTSDVVEIFDFHEGIPVVRFRYRANMVSNVCGEKLSSFDLQKLISATSAALECPVIDYTFSVENDEQNGTLNYVLWVEIGNVSHKITSNHVDDIDKNLCDLNKSYRMRRASEQIKQMKVNVCDPGTFGQCYDYLDKQSRNPRGQLKMPRLVKAPRLLEILFHGSQYIRG